MASFMKRIPKPVRGSIARQLTGVTGSCKRLKISMDRAGYVGCGFRVRDTDFSWGKYVPCSRMHAATSGKGAFLTRPW